MHQHLSFMSKLINQKSAQSFNISKQTVHYLTKIIDSLINGNTSILDYDKLKVVQDGVVKSNLSVYISYFKNQCFIENHTTPFTSNGYENVTRCLYFLFAEI